MRYFVFFSFIILLCFLHSIVSAYNLIQHTCKSCSETDPNISYEFCITSLQADPRSHHAKNLSELGLISIKLIRLNVTATRVHLKELLKNLDPFIKECVDDCLELYSDAILTLREAIKDYKAKRYADSNIKVNSVIDASTACEDRFEEKKGVPSPLTKRNNDTFQLSAIALSIINVLGE